MDGAVNILSLDGGGIRGVSMLIILDQIMKRIQYDNGLAETPQPCEYFHLIGGTGTGGLIALMLGRLKMSTREALQKYTKFAEAIFGRANRKARHKDGEFKASTLEKLVRDVIAEKSLGECIRPENDPSNFANTFVCAVPAANTAHPRLFRSYAVRENPSPSCKIWEAARATTAAPLFFKRITIEDENGVKEDFLDGALLHNNPAQLALGEAFRVFGGASKLGCLVSLGTGHPGTIGLSKPDTFQKILPTEMVGVLKRMATDCEQTAHELAGRFRRSRRYFRYNVNHGVSNVSLKEWEKISEISSHTKSYLEDVEVSNSVDKVVEILCRRSGVGEPEISLLSICEAVPSPEKLLLETAIRHQHPSTSLFTGREEYISALEAFFTVQASEPPPRREYLLYGMGGAGKTQIALRFAEEYRSRYDQIFWLDATNKNTLEQGYQGIASKIDGDPSKKYSLDEALQRLADYEGRWLLLFDGADTLADVKDFFPPGLYGDIIYTSKNGMLRRLPETHTKCVLDMSPEEATTLLLKAAHLTTSSASQRDLATNIVKELGYLALAIDQAGAYILSGECKIEDFLETFNRNHHLLLHKEAYEGASVTDQAVYATWDLSYAAIVRQAECAADESLNRGPKAALQILQVLPFLHNENISEELFKRVAETEREFPWSQSDLEHQSDLEQHFMSSICPCANGTWDNQVFRQGIRTLVSFSLIQRNVSGGQLSLHRLVHLWSFDRLTAVEKDLYGTLARRVLVRPVEFLPTKTRDFAFYQDLLTHITASQRRLVRSSKEEDHDWEMVVALVHSEAGRLSEAEELAKKAFTTCKQRFDGEDLRTHWNALLVAQVYNTQGNYKAALELSENFVKNYGKRGPEEYPILLIFILYMIIAFLELGRFDEALKSQLQLLKWRGKELALEYPDASCCTDDSSARHQDPLRAAIESYFQALENEVNALDTAGKDEPEWELDWSLGWLELMASAVGEQGRPLEAERLQLRAMEIRKKAFGIEHRSMTSSMSNLAFIYRHLNRLHEAEKLELQVLETLKKVSGVEHPKTLNSINKLATLYRYQKRLDEAETLELQVLEIRKKNLSTEHPLTLNSMNRLTIIYRDQNRLDEAERLGLHVLEAQKRTLGGEHHDTLDSLNGLAMICFCQKRLDEAERLLLRVLETQKRTFGIEHPDTLNSLDGLVGVYVEQGRLDEAERLKLQAWEAREKMLGAEHPDTLFSLDALAKVYFGQERLDEAKRLRLQVWEARKKMLGVEHPKTLTSLDGLVEVYFKQGRLDEAKRLKLQVWKAREKVLGAKHAETIKSMQDYAIILLVQIRRSHPKEPLEMSPDLLFSALFAVNRDEQHIIDEFERLIRNYDSQYSCATEVDEDSPGDLRQSSYHSAQEASKERGKGDDLGEESERSVVVIIVHAL